MVFKRKQVLCSNCGFLGWSFAFSDEGGSGRLVECSSYWRKQIQHSKKIGPEVDYETGESISPICVRRQWIFSSVNNPELNYINLDKLVEPRKCVYYIQYQPGFGPEAHKELKREAETRSAIFRASLIGAIIGACAAIAAQLLYVWFIR